ncbi:class I SAM-dependent methyltransferase [Kribbella solani]|uniref:class I SAM-dependent methyltransferase n=1 Tax=Kribbella solani TaxID=236067 RepID=UPI0029BED15B|nr:class I SAM-dependent methyltransferase [Kribbella solani]MDX2968786.1 class I SAM-dependent methyltransferase [Kribbella solani]MDX3000495.1 class I SAM-dependent methyltransferase [Kribbella solani]
MTELAATFQYEAVAAAYQYRPPYPDEVFDRLEGLIGDEPRRVLDIGAGEGAIARPLAPRVEWVDAIDFSQRMVDAGRRRPGGDRPNLSWQVSPIETADLDGPYALVTAGASIHWMPWAETFARIVPHLTPKAQLVVIEHGAVDEPWLGELLPILERHSRKKNHDPSFSVVDAIRDRGLLELTGTARTARVTYRQSVADYIEKLHSTSSLARDLMTPDEAAAFDQSVEQTLRPYAHDGVLDLSIEAQLSWGRPVQQPGTAGSAAPERSA